MTQEAKEKIKSEIRENVKKHPGFNQLSAFRYISIAYPETTLKDAVEIVDELSFERPFMFSNYA